MNLSGIPVRVVAWGCLALALLGGFLVWDGQVNREIDRKELAGALAALRQAEQRAGDYQARTLVLQAQIDSLAKVRAHRDTVYVAKRDTALPLLDPVLGITADSAAKLLPAVQNACREALNACDAYKASAEAEMATLRTRVASDSSRVTVLTGDLTAANNRILELLTAGPEPLTFMQKLERVGKVTLLILALVGSFLLGHAL